MSIEINDFLLNYLKFIICGQSGETMSSKQCICGQGRETVNVTKSIIYDLFWMVYVAFFAW